MGYEAHVSIIIHLQYKQLKFGSTVEFNDYNIKENCSLKSALDVEWH